MAGPSSTCVDARAQLEGRKPSSFGSAAQPVRWLGAFAPIAHRAPRVRLTSLIAEPTKAAGRRPPPIAGRRASIGASNPPATRRASPSTGKPSDGPEAGSLTRSTSRSTGAACRCRSSSPPVKLTVTRNCCHCLDQIAVGRDAPEQAFQHWRPSEQSGPERHRVLGTPTHQRRSEA
jgi:hypothetical protein